MEKEVLTDDELEMVSGGYKDEHASQLAGLVKFGIVNMKDISAGPISAQVLEKAKNNLAKHGVIAVFHDDLPNEYFIVKGDQKIGIDYKDVYKHLW